MRKLKKLIALSLLSTLLMTTIQPMALAGVVKELVEVDPQQREIDIREEADKKDQYKKDVLKQQEKAVEKAKEIIEKQAPVPTPAPVAKASPKADTGKYEGCFICKVAGVITGLVVSPVVGLSRGTLSKAMKHAGSYKEFMGDGVFGIVIGAPVGLVTGGALGAVTGLANGVATGLVKGVSDPLSSQNYSTTAGDYDPYDFLVGGLD